MRRKDKEIRDIKEMNEIIRKSVFCNVAMSRNNIPYIVPMNFGFHEQCIFLHSANEGLKIDILKENPLVCIEIIPDAQLVKSKDQCNSSMKYRSVLISGKVEFLSAESEKKKALGYIVQHYDKNIKEDELDLSNYNFDRLIVLKVKIEKVTGKKSG